MICLIQMMMSLESSIRRIFYFRCRKRFARVTVGGAGATSQL